MLLARARAQDHFTLLKIYYVELRPGGCPPAFLYLGEKGTYGGEKETADTPPHMSFFVVGAVIEYLA